jgi:hypothetical protein
MKTGIAILGGLLAGVVVALGILAALVLIGPGPGGLRPTAAPASVPSVAPSPSRAPVTSPEPSASGAGSPAGSLSGRALGKVVYPASAWAAFWMIPRIKPGKKPNRIVSTVAAASPLQRSRPWRNAGASLAGSRMYMYTTTRR